MALLLIVLFGWIAAAFGQTIVASLLHGNSPLERFVYGTAVGLGVAAYGAFALGLCGLLAPLPLALWWGVLAITGLKGMRALVTDLRVAVRRVRKGGGSAEHVEMPDAETPESVSRRVLWIRRLSGATMLVFLLIAVVACFRPPGAVEWDVLAYHLADPKVFLQQHRISILPTEHHSNFPFTVEMLFVVGLAFNGYALANLFHLLLAVLTALAILNYGERQFGSGAGYLGALLFTSTPLVLWEASVAYIDVGVALYTSLATFALLSVRYTLPKPTDTVAETTYEAPPPQLREAGGLERETQAGIVLAGLLMGFALGIKYLALIPLVLLALLMLWRRLPWRRVAAYVLIALAVGSPWYIKNAVQMHNPVYPFYYRLFPGSRYWSLGRELAYRSEQARFGYPHSLSEPRETLINLLEVPWRTLVHVDHAAEGHQYFNQGEITFSACFGGLYAALCFALLLRRVRGPDIGPLSALALAQLVIWFFLAQIGRYLIQILPLFAVLSGAAAANLLDRPKWQDKKREGMLLRGVTVALLAGNVVVVLASVLVFPSGGREAREFTQQTGLMPTALSFHASLEAALHPEVATNTLSRQLDVYDSEQWLNRNTAPTDGVVLYEETRGYYLDRPYVWGNDNHSTYIPYDRFKGGEDLTAWMNAHGYRYALINLNWSPHNTDHHPISPEEAEALLRNWYVDSEAPVGIWSRTVGDAVRKGLWSVVDVTHGNVILRIGSGTVRGGERDAPFSGRRG